MIAFRSRQISVDFVTDSATDSEWTLTKDSIDSQENRRVFSQRHMLDNNETAWILSRVFLSISRQKACFLPK